MAVWGWWVHNTGTTGTDGTFGNIYSCKYWEFCLVLWTYSVWPWELVRWGCCQSLGRWVTASPGTQTSRLLILSLLPSDLSESLFSRPTHTVTFTTAYTHTAETGFVSLTPSLCLRLTHSLSPLIGTLAVRESLLAGMTLWPCFLTGLQDTQQHGGRSPSHVKEAISSKMSYTK